MNLPGIEGQLMAAREYWSDKREAELTRLRERVAELERDLRDTTWQDHADAWQKRALAAEAKFAAAERDAARWHDGATPKPFDSEWFIAELKSGDRTVLRALPEEYAYDYKTADESYIKRGLIVRWMQFPDSQFVPFAAMAPRSDVEGEQS